MSEPWKRKEVFGDCTLYLGDCLEILPTLEKVDAVITDPPYGVDLIAKQHKWFKNEGTGYGLIDDDESIYERIIGPTVNYLLPIIKRAAITPGQRLLRKYPQSKSMGCIYNRAGTGISPWGFNCFTPILFYGACPFLEHGLGSRPNSWEQPPNDYSDKNDHPCPKPVGLMNWLVNRASHEDDIVLDPFMGSGTTGVACVNLGRKFIGVEIEEKYFDIACSRIENAQRQTKLFEPEQIKPLQEKLFA